MAVTAPVKRAICIDTGSSGNKFRHCIGNHRDIRFFASAHINPFTCGIDSPIQIDHITRQFGQGFWCGLVSFCVGLPAICCPPIRLFRGADRGKPVRVGAISPLVGMDTCYRVARINKKHEQTFASACMAITTDIASITIELPTKPIAPMPILLPNSVTTQCGDFRIGINHAQTGRPFPRPYRSFAISQCL